MIPEIGVEFVAECVSGYNLRHSHAMGNMFQARLRRLPEGTDMDDACTVPYFILEDGTWRETYQHEVGAEQVVCEFLGDYLSPEQEAEQFKEELLDRHNVFTLEDAINLRDRLNKYLEGQGFTDPLQAENTHLNQRIAVAKEAMQKAQSELGYMSCPCLRQMRPVGIALGVE
jgi:hypothetical protein